MSDTETTPSDPRDNCLVEEAWNAAHQDLLILSETDRVRARELIAGIAGGDFNAADGLIGSLRRNGFETTCHLCGFEVDMNLDPQLPLGRSVDELIPIADNGDPLDPTNCRLAHRCCNSSRGRRQITEAIRKRCRELVLAKRGNTTYRCQVQQAGSGTCTWPTCGCGDA